MNSANIPKSERKKLWMEFVNTHTLIENSLVTELKSKPSHESFHKEKVDWIPHMRKFGEMGISKDHKTVKKKLDNRGIPVMFLGYSEDHAPDTYRVWNPATERVMISRDIDWLDMNHGE